MTMCRRARSFMSRARFQRTLVGSRSMSRKWSRLSIAAASRLWAAVIAWKSPVNWRLIVFDGSTPAGAAAGRSPLAAEDRPHRRLPQRQGRVLADPAQALGQADRRRRLPLAGRRRRDRRDQDQLARRPVVLAASASSRTFALSRPYGSRMLGGDLQVAGHLGDRSDDAVPSVRVMRLGSSRCDWRVVGLARPSSVRVEILVEVDPDHPRVLPDPGDQRDADRASPARTSRKQRPVREDQVLDQGQQSDQRDRQAHS